MSNLNTMLNKYATQDVTIKTTSSKNPHRIELGSLFMQPTGGPSAKEPQKAWRFDYCYFGMADKSGKFLGGITMNNLSMLQAVETGHLSKDFIKLFDAYASTHVANGEEVLKLKA